MAGTSLFKDKLSEFKSDANDVVFFKLVRKKEDIDDDATCFHPVMSHQVFGQTEVIFGFKGLRISLYYTAAQLLTYLSVTYDEKINPTEFEGVKADKVIEDLTKQISKDYFTRLDDLSAALEKEHLFKPFGEMIYSYDTDIDNINRHFEIYRTSIEAPGFRAYHERLQTFLLWYVDAASFIDVDDSKWSFYLVYERYQTAEGNRQYATVGYQTVYRYYAWPDKVRPRISQVLILPPYQRQGHGAQLLTTFYKECWTDRQVLDITVEDPSEDYQRLRDFIDVRNCMKLSTFHENRLVTGFSKDMFEQANQAFKLNKKQARRVYEILRLRHASPDNIKEYASFIKKRLNLPFQKSHRELLRLRKCLNPEEYAATETLDEQQRTQYLDDAYQELSGQYRHILERLAAAT